MRSFQVEKFGEPLAEVGRDTPRPAAGEVLLKVDACGVCHSDVHMMDGYFDLGDGKKLDLTRVVSPPRTLGHEILGTVVSAGPQASGVQAGDRRVVFPWIGCGACALCAAGDEHLCNNPQSLGVQRDGGFADHVLVPDAKYLLEYDPLPDTQACTYACAGLTAFSALKKAGPLAASEPLLIIGAGGVGLSGIRLARKLYDTAPIVAEVDKAKWDVAREAGAGELIDPTAEGALKALLKSTSGGVAAAIDFVGMGATFAFGHVALRKAGRLVCVGLFGGSTPIAPAMVAMKAVTIMGSYVGSLAEMRALLAIARSSALPELPIAIRKLADVNAALADLKQGRVRGRCVLRP
jgi:alcohol dehydrogenase/propanol-preferring alcohol dehydrogenase